MKIGHKALKASTLLGAGQLISYGCSFLRNVILARALTKTDYGTAAALSLMMSAFELTSKLSFGQQVVQAKDGDHEDFQAATQFCQFVAGCTGALLIALLGGPMARLFHVPQAAWAFMLMSLIGVLNGLQHMDMTRFARGLDFSKRFKVDVIPDLTTALVCYPVAHFFKDYRAVVCILMLRSVLLLTVSHSVAERPYRWSVNPAYMRRIIAFGWPLLANGFLMFACQQGDQVLIGAHFDLASLALYSLGVQITVVPGLMFQYVVNSVMLPLLSQVQDEPAKYRRRYVFCAELATVAGVLIATFLILGGEFFVTTAFGQKYSNSGAIVGWLAVGNAFRIMRSAPSVAAMARGDTMNNLICNIFRLTSFGLAALAIYLGKPIVWVAACGMFGEALALFVSSHRLSKRCGVPITLGLKSVSVAAAIVAICHILLAVSDAYPSHLITVVFCAAGSIGAFLAMWRLFGEFRRHALESVGHVPSLAFLGRMLAWCGNV